MTFNYIPRMGFADLSAMTGLSVSYIRSLPYNATGRRVAKSSFKQNARREANRRKAR